MYYNLYRKIYLFIHVYILVNCSQVGVVTIPIPLLLNAVWFWQMLKDIYKDIVIYLCLFIYLFMYSRSLFTGGRRHHTHPAAAQRRLVLADAQGGGASVRGHAEAESAREWERIVYIYMPKDQQATRIYMNMWQR